MEQFERIRRDARDDEMSIRALADKHKVHRRTVRAALTDAVPPVRKQQARTAPVLGRYVATIRGWLVEDLTAPRKQRHTARGERAVRPIRPDLADRLRSTLSTLVEAWLLDRHRRSAPVVAGSRPRPTCSDPRG